ncbi:MAG: phage head closure protein [Beijerinckiaceae bacterium]
MRRARIGDLDRRITIEAPLDTIDDIGGVNRVWTHVDDVWAQVTPIAGREDFAAEREESAVTHRVLVRWRPDITGVMRLRLDARVLAIHAALDWDSRRRFLLLQCEEIT